jgi:DNA adenine methylase
MTTLQNITISASPSSNGNNKIDTLEDKNAQCLPFLRWAGGKRWLLKQLHNYLPINGFNQYHEPFIGGGSIFFHLQPEKAFISDLNKELIDTYKAVQQDVELVIIFLKEFKNTEEDYYQIRSVKFDDFFQEAARFIYLNQTSFNGLYRVNLNGNYNVPYGKRHKHKFDYDNLRKASKNIKNTSFSSGDFSGVIQNVKKGDLVFLDPPYTVTHNSNGFIQYNQKIFSLSEQYRLSEMIDKVKDIGAYYILTNAAHPEVKNIFQKDDSFFEVSRASVIGGKGSKRGKYAELIMTNGV